MAFLHQNDHKNYGIIQGHIILALLNSKFKLKNFFFD